MRTSVVRSEKAHCGDEGAVTVTACLALVSVLAITVLAAQVGVAVAARHRVQAAADLAALAAAGDLDSGIAAACAQAAEIGRRMGARLMTCVPDGWDVTVELAGRVELGPMGVREVCASARAGPPGDWR
ncbi:Rv3654c family TadE-like protein [Nocardia sp. NPDC020380]|uniref:Rv3654c family TadE-like protein n=1 Tax=Nocardia sp. NPDC020380 TaxID=3364309 RepID=UPI00378EACB4